MQNYTGFLTFLKEHFDIRPLKDHERRMGNRSVCLLRHDVLEDFEDAVEMATTERNLGIKGTYFILPTAKEFNADRVKKIKSLGHEIGLHNDILQRCLKSRRVGYARRLFEENLKAFKKHDIAIHGISSVPGTLSGNTNNTDIFKEYHKRGKLEKVRHTALFTISLKKYGMYEAGLLLSDHKFNDLGGVWNEGTLDNIGIFPFLQNLATSGHTIIQVIIHPAGWD